MTSRARREVLGSRADSGSGTPKVRPVPRGTYAFVGPRLGRTETFWGQAEKQPTAAWAAMTRRARRERARTTAPGMLRRARPPTPSGPAGRQRPTKTPSGLRRAEVCPARWPRAGAHRRLTRAITAGTCSHKSFVWDLESSAVHVWPLRT